MKRAHLASLAILIAVSLQLAACRSPQTAAEPAGEEAGPARVVHNEGGPEASRVTLTEDAVKRLDIHAESVRDVELEGATQRVVPYDAVLYDPEGETWMYTNPEPRVYVRTHITVESIVGTLAVLKNGPPAGTSVVTTGAAELFGAESEFEEE
jgi:hypothetical protein